MAKRADHCTLRGAPCLEIASATLMLLGRTCSSLGLGSAIVTTYFRCWFQRRCSCGRIIRLVDELRSANQMLANQMRHTSTINVHDVRTWVLDIC